MNKNRDEDTVRELDALPGDDPEQDHIAADQHLLNHAHPDVAAAYQRVKDRCGPWWYS